jgi:hypothetical protein
VACPASVGEYRANFRLKEWIEIVSLLGNRVDRSDQPTWENHHQAGGSDAASDGSMAKNFHGFSYWQVEKRQVEEAVCSINVVEIT